MTKTSPARSPRRWWKVFLAFFLLSGILIGCLPWLLGSKLGRSRVADRINQALAPGRLEFQSLHLSWFGPTRIKAFSLFDPQGRRVASSPSATINRSMAQWIFGASGPVELTILDASIDVERSPDGSIDLVNALRSLIAHPDPRRNLAIKIDGGTLRYRDPFLAEPSTADAIDLDLRIRPAPDMVSWKLKLARGDSILEVQGDYDHWLSKGGPPRLPELEVAIQGKKWPFVARTAGVDALGKLDGSMDFLRRKGQWRLSGDARILGFNAQGAPLKGDTLAIERLDAGWDVTQGEDGWMIRRLSLTSPIGDLKAEGRIGGPGGPGKQRIEGRIDLASMARQLPHALRLRDGLTVDRGSARLTIDLEDEPGRTSFEAQVQVSDLSAQDGDRALSLRDPATVSARLIRQGEHFSLERFTVKTAFLDASARGKLTEGVDFEGRLDLARFRRQLGDWIDLGQLDLAGQADLSGSYRFRPSGSPVNDRERAIDGDETVLRSPRFENTLKAAFRDLRIEGVGPGPIRRDSATLELSAEGLAEASGWPVDWLRGSLIVGSEQSMARVELRSNRDPARESAQIAAPAWPIGVSAEFVLPWSAPQSPDRVVSGSMTGSWPESGPFLISRVGTRVDTHSNPRTDSLVEVQARGRLDLSTGELVLEAVPATAPNTISLDNDGIRVSGIGKGLPALRVDAGLTGNLGSLAELAGQSSTGLSSRWTAMATARGDADGVQFAAKVGLDPTPDPSNAMARPSSIAARAHYLSSVDRLDLSEFTVSTAYGTIDASGRIDAVSGLRRIDLQGRVAPDFAAINAELVRRVEPGASVVGEPRTFRVSGLLDGSFPSIDAEVGFNLGGADIYGMKFGPSPVVVRAKGGKLIVDPISTSINEGHIRLEPEIDLEAPGGPMLRLAKNSSIREARINDEVSRRVLAYVAPILDQTTRARGLVSVDLDHAEFPIGLGRGRQTQVEGAVVFEDVEFAPGPLANDLLSAIGRRDLSMKLDRPVTLTIADGRINQRGMSLPIGDLTRIEMAGWVDFDRNLAITATLPVTPAMLGNNPLLTDIVAGTQVRLPITGTLDRPVIDRDAMTANLQELGKSLLARGATRGAMELLMRIGRPRDPNVPRPPQLTPEQRKAQRQEKKAIRRGEVRPPTGVNPGR